MNAMIDGPADAAITLLFAHGAGAPMDSLFMTTIAAGIAAAGVRVVRFEFAYMAARRAGGPMRPPDAMPRLVTCWRQAIADHGGGATLAIGGKSLGGRVASLIADEVGARSLICLGFPFHAPGKPAAPRIAHLARLATPTLIVQGTRDPLGNRDDVATYALSPAIRLHWVESGDHSLELPRGRGPTANAAWPRVAAAAAAFLTGP